MQAILRMPKAQLSLLLFVIFLSVFLLSPSLELLSLLILTVGLTIFFDLLFTYIRKRKFFTPYAALATSLIISLIVDPSVSFLQLAVITAIAMGAKNWIRFSNRHIFNPGAFGLFVGGLVFQLPVSWWGVASQVPIISNPVSLILFLILISPLYVSSYKMSRYISTSVFILVYATLSIIITGDITSTSLLRVLLDPTTLFFAAVMLPEPMTSPINKKRQALYGTAVAAITILISLFATSFFLPDVLLPALLIGNLLFFRYR